MLKTNKKICIAGRGGFAKEVLCLIVDALKGTNIKYKDFVVFMERDENFQKGQDIYGVKVIPQSSFDPSEYDVTVAIGSPATRLKVVKSLPTETTFATLIHPSVIMSEWVKLGEGAVICAGSILTCDIEIGKHVQLNLHTTIGHDFLAGDYFTTAPAVNISGNCNFGHRIYFGTNACCREKISICDDVVIGMGGSVIKAINEPGIYIGSPASKLEKK